MNTINKKAGSMFLIAGFCLTTLFSACHFDSDKDYVPEEEDHAADSLQRGDEGFQQHNESKPPLDAVGKDSLQQNMPGSNDSTVRGDSASNSH
jgi:hypothetical protein